VKLPIRFTIAALGNVEAVGEIEIPDQLIAPGDNRLAVSVQDAAGLVGVSSDLIRQEVRSGALRAKRAGARLVISVEALRAWVHGTKPERQRRTA